MSEASFPQRGTIIQLPTGATPGLIQSDGRQWPFGAEAAWESPVAPALNQNVEFATDLAGAVGRIRVVSGTQAAVDKFCQVSNAAAEWAQGPGLDKLRELGEQGVKTVQAARAGQQARRQAAAARPASASSAMPARTAVILVLEVVLWVALLLAVVIGGLMGYFSAGRRNAEFGAMLGLLAGGVTGVLITGFGMTLISINAHLAGIRDALQRQTPD